MSEEMRENTETMDDMKEALEASFKKVNVGDTLTGTIISVGDDEVLVDLKTYVEGVISRENMSSDPAFNMKEELHEGDEVTATVIAMDRNTGNAVLSRKEASDRAAWEKFRTMMTERTPMTVQILEANKGGLAAKVEGFRAFIPASRVAAGYVENLEEYVGKPLDVTIIEVDEEKKRLVLSGRELARKKADEEKKAKIRKCEVGAIMNGVVETLKPYGAFITLDNGLSGLVHVSQISRKRVANPASVLKEGQPVVVKIIAIKDGKLSLSMKELEAEEVPDDEVPEYKNSGELTTTLGDLFKNIRVE